MRKLASIELLSKTHILKKKYNLFVGVGYNCESLY